MNERGRNHLCSASIPVKNSGQSPEAWVPGRSLGTRSRANSMGLEIFGETPGIEDFTSFSSIDMIDVGKLHTARRLRQTEPDSTRQDTYGGQ